MRAGMVLSAFGEEEEPEPGEEPIPVEEPAQSAACKCSPRRPPPLPTGEEPIPVEEPPKPPPKSDLLVEKPWPQEHSLCIFGPRNGIRR